MKMHIMSDLHFEFHRDGGRKFQEDLDPKDADVLALAGDIVPIRFLDQVLRVFKAFCKKYKDVVYVPGNHEYYDSSPRIVSKVLEAVSAQLPNLHILNHGSTKIGGRRILGGTMWFRNTPMNAMLANRLTDFQLIQKFVPWVYEQNAAFESYLGNELREGDVVITHHLPTPLSVQDRYKHDALNIFFLCDISKELLRKKPKLWIHGHTHNACDYVVGDTRVICNPLGYPFEAKPFRDDLIVEV